MEHLERKQFGSGFAVCLAAAVACLSWHTFTFGGNTSLEATSNESVGFATECGESLGTRRMRFHSNDVRALVLQQICARKRLHVRMSANT